MVTSNVNTSSTLDAADWAYEFEKTRIAGATDENILSRVQSKNSIPSNLEYIDDDYDPFTGTSATAFRDKTTGEVIVAYTGTNKDSDAMNDIVESDVGGILLGMGVQYQPAYDFYEQIADKYGAENITVTGHSLGGNVAQRVALKYNAPNTVVYNSAPLYIPPTASTQMSGGNLLTLKNVAEISYDQMNFTGKVTRITTGEDPLNIVSDAFMGVYLGEEYILNQSGGHLISDIRASGDQVAQVNKILEGVGSPRVTQMEQEIQNQITQAPTTVKSKMKAVQDKLNAFKTNDNKGQAADASGLTGAEKIYIDYAQAYVIASGLSTAANSAVTLLASKEVAAVAQAESLMLNLERPVGTLLTEDEIKAAYAEAGVDNTTIVDNVKTHCADKKKEFSDLATSFTDVQNNIQSGLQEMVQTDSDLAALISG